ncbi:MAG: hypothetical protein AABZ28_05695 [Nitrospinota bacterium]
MKKIIIGLLIILLSYTNSIAEGDRIVIIANHSFPRDSLTSSQIKEIYLGKMEIIDNIRIQSLDQKDSSPIKKDFLEKFIDFSISDYKAYWIKKVFKKGRIPPTIKDSSEEIIKAIKEEKSYIGYVWEGEIKNIKDVKILFKIDNP